ASPAAPSRTGRALTRCRNRKFRRHADMGGRVIGTNHTSFTVSDLERALGLSRAGLGFEVTSKAPRDPKLSSQITGVAGAELLIAFVRAPGHVIELIEYKAPAEKGRVVSRPCDAGFSHIAFNVDDVDAVLEAVRPYGVEPIAVP